MMFRHFTPELSDAELTSFARFRNRGVPGKEVPPAHRAKLLRLWYIEEKLVGDQLTEEGKRVLESLLRGR
jgi:hypothetical protein